MDILIAAFQDRDKAQSLVNRLKAAAIRARLADDGPLQSLVFWTRPFATYKVMVPEEAFEPANALVHAWDKKEPFLDAAIHCPDCGSLRIEYPQYTRKFITPLLIEWLISMGFAEKQFYCKDCHYTWPPNPKAEPKRDLLGWPEDRPPSAPVPTEHSRRAQSETSGSNPPGSAPKN